VTRVLVWPQGSRTFSMEIISETETVLSFDNSSVDLETVVEILGAFQEVWFILSGHNGR